MKSIAKIWAPIAAMIGAFLLIVDGIQGFNTLKSAWSTISPPPRYEILQPNIPEASDFTILKSIEQQYITKYASVDSTVKITLPQAYFDANKMLFNYLSEIEDSIDHDKQKFGIIWVMAPAGAGKSFIFRLMKARNIIINKIDLKKITQRRHPDTIHNLADLRNVNSAASEYIFNELPAIKASIPFNLQMLLSSYNVTMTNTKPSWIIIDGIDEIHNSSAETLLRNLDEFIAARAKENKAPLYIFVFGRPEGFRGMKDIRKFDQPVTCKKFTLENPKFNSKALFKIFIDDYNQVSVDSVNPKRTLQNMDLMASKYPFVVYSMSNLQLGNFVIQESSAGVFSEDTFKDRLFEDLLSRNSDVMNRPGKDDLLYKNLLKAVAIKYKNSLDSHGFFQVQPNDLVAVRENYNGETRQIEVRVTDLLDRSGLIFLSPTSFRTTRYQFHPFWVHSYLLKKKFL